MTNDNIDRHAVIRAHLVASGEIDNEHNNIAWLSHRIEMLEGQLAKAADPVNGPVQLAIHRAVCEDSLAHCSENRGRCVRSAEAAAWALGLDRGGSGER